jgi:HEAT repeat protein
VSSDRADPPSDDAIVRAIAQLDGEHEWEVAAAQATLRDRVSEAEPALIHALDEGQSSIQAATLLGQIGGDASVRPLAVAAARGGDGLRWHALMALAAIQSPLALDALVAFAGSERADVRSTVASALARRSEARARRTLDELSQDADAAVRDASRRAMESSP